MELGRCSRKNSWTTGSGTTPPTEETAPKHATIEEAYAKASTEVRHVVSGTADKPTRHGAVSAALREFLETIDDVCPDGANKAAAARCVRLARNAANECIANGGDVTRGSRLGLETLMGMFHQEMVKARWQANTAIACGD